MQSDFVSLQELCENASYNQPPIFRKTNAPSTYWLLPKLGMKILQSSLHCIWTTNIAQDSYYGVGTKKRWCTDGQVVNNSATYQLVRRDGLKFTQWLNIPMHTLDKLSTFCAVYL